ncbi:MAG: DUF2934 domain-containing protein [Methylotenera sp.]
MKTKSIKSKNALSPSLNIKTGSSPHQCNEDLTRRIAELAYYKAEARGFEPGHEMEDWLSAEKETVQ